MLQPLDKERTNRRGFAGDMVKLSQRTRVERCALCGAPLPLPQRDAYVVRCDYCHEENRLVAQETEDAIRRSEAVTRAADEARAMERRLRARRQELEEAFGEGMLRFTQDRSAENGAAVLHAYEALLRIVQAPSVHIAQAMGPPGEDVLRTIDSSIKETVAEFAKENGVDCDA